MRRLLLAAVAVAVLTTAVRAALLLRSGGLFGAFSIDDGVHFAAAVALVGGRVPYRDFLFLHPPGIVLALTPFAVLARAIGDADAFALARAVFIAIGAGSTGLIVLVLRRFGLAAGIVGAAVAAVSFPVVYAERSALLEPLGAAGLLGALALLVEPSTRRRRVLAGVLLGLVAVVKLPFALPALVIALAAGRRSPAVLACAGATAGVVCAPFLVLAGPAMLQQIVLDQAGRRRIVPSAGARLAQIFPPPVVGALPGRLLLAAVLALLAALLLLAVRTAGARCLAVLVVADTAMLLAGPSFYGHYAVLAALPAAMLVGVGFARLVGVARTTPGGRALTAGSAAVIAVLVLGPWTPGAVDRLTTPPLPAPVVAAVGSVRGCVRADLATALVEADAATRQVERGCSLWPDVTGWQYADRARRPGRPPQADPRYQARVLAQLRTGSAALLCGSGDDLSRTSWAVLRAGRAVAASGRCALREYSEL